MHFYPLVMIRFLIANLITNKVLQPEIFNAYNKKAKESKEVGRT